MNNRSEERIAMKLREMKKRRWQIGMLFCLCLLVVVGVAGFFHLPARAKTYQKWVLTCPAEASAGPGYAGFFLHMHNDDCFDENGSLVCPLPEIKAHVHDENCFVVLQELDCAIPESDGHRHTAECYTRVRGDLSCELSTEPVLDEEGNVLEEGHVHTDECYAWHEELSCGMEEGEGAHHHDESCYRTVTTLTCDKPELIPHVHTDACYKVDEAGNVSLICGVQELTEHVHGPECFTVCELDDGEPEETAEPAVYTTEDSTTAVSGTEDAAAENATTEVGITETGTEEEAPAPEASDARNTEDAPEDGFIFLYPEENETEIEAETWISTEDSDTDNTDPENVDPENADEARTAESETIVTEAADEENTEQESREADPADSQETADKETAEGEQETEETSEAIPCVQLGGEKDGATVLAEVPESILGEIARLSFSDYSADEARAAILSAVNENAAEGEEREITALYVIDIGLDVNGEPVISEGETPIRITIRAKEIRGMTAPKVYQLINGTAVRIKEADFDPEAGTVSFTAYGFSAFAIADLTGKDPADEAPEETPASVSMPAQTFSGETEDVVVSVSAPEGAFPEGTTMEVRMVEVDDETMSSVEKAVEGKVTTVQAVDITFYDADGNKIEPQTAIQVSMKSAMVSESENVSLIHKPDAVETDDPEAEAPALEVMEAAIVEQEDTAAPSDEITFESNAFSVYMLVGTETITVPFVAGDGSTYEVTITYRSDAGIPQGSALTVTELAKDSEEYQEYLEQTASAVGTEADVLDYLKILDISIVNGEEKVVLQAPVDVQIKLFDREITEEAAGEKTKVVHFGEDATYVIDPDQEGSTVSFETTGFSYYAVTSYGVTADLAGKSYAIVQVNTQAAQEQATGNNTVYQGRTLTTTAQNDNTRLGGATVSVETHESGLNIVTSGTTQIVEWTFEAVEGENTYYIKAPNGQYLNLSGNNALELSNTPQALTITAGTGNTAGKVRISNGDRRVQSSVSAGASRTANNNQYFYNGNSNDANYVYMTLCEIKEFDPNQYPVYSGEKISVQNLVDGQKYIIYKNIYNEMTGEYEDWVIDGNGNPVRAYDQGNSLSLHSEISPMWVLSILTNSSGQANGYYLFRNEKTGLILHPLADGTLVKEYDSETSPTTDGVALKGREGGEYTSTIEYWDGSAMAYYGYQFTTDGEVALTPGTGSDSQVFSFAEEPVSSDGLHPVATVDSAANGITIHMFNYPNRNTIANVTGSDGYAVGVQPKQHVTATLTDEYPAFTNGKSGSALFTPGNSHYKGTGNHLFLESIYDSTGYYEFSAFNNFAHYNSNGSFTVYQETGTPSPTSSNFYFKRGNFFPYNTLNTNNTAQNIYTGDGSLIDYENPSYGSTLYGLKETTDFYFGMTMDFHFLMPKDGYYNGSPLIYEFNGDDDLWIYIDDVLILDIGGVHDAFPGSINFVTGEITGGNGGAGGARTIKDCFKIAGVFPDGTAWDDSKVDEYFNGNTFASYGSHQFNMFYMEHGAGASNLMMRFNLPVIEKGKYTVEKKLDNTSQVDYANVSFAYQAFGKVDGNYTPMTSAVYEGRTDASGNPVPLVFYNNVVIDGKTYDNVFYLKPNEAAVFSDLPEEELYYVQEIGIKSDYYDEIFVNDVKIDGETAEAQDGVYRSSEATVQNRARVTYTNRCDAMNSNELQIKKLLAEGSENNGDTFEFRVMLENAAGTLAAYYQGTYYIRDDNGVYYRYQNGTLVSNGQTPYACTAGNYGTIGQIPPGYTVVITDLLAGTDFYVDEIRVRPNGSSTDVLLGDSEWILTGTEVSGADEAQITDATIWDYATNREKTDVPSLGCIKWGEDAKVVFTNKRKAADVKLKKTGDDGETALSGSSFDLSRYTNGVWSNIIRKGIRPGAAATDTEPAVPNPADLGDLAVGKYMLTETKAPDGYIISTKQIYFEVYSDTTDPEKSMKVRLIDKDGNPLTDEQIEESGNAVKLAFDDKESSYTITVINYLGVELPQTGGRGTALFTALGGIMTATAGAILTLRKRKGHA